MGTQGPGRKRIANRERLSAEDDALNLIARESSRGSYYSDLPLYGTGLGSKSHSASQNGTRVSAYDGIGSRRYSTSSSHAPSEHNCFLGSSSRTSSRASSARASPVVEERVEKDFTEKGSRAASSLSAATLASLGGTSSRRGSGETTTSMDTEGSIREIKEIFELKDQIQDVEGKYMEGLKELKDSLAEVEEKYKKAMVSNAQLDNEKTNLMYQVDTLRESLLELEEQLAETHRMHEEKTKELDRQKHAYSILQQQFETMKETLKEREEMLMEIKELNQKQHSSAQEIADLQETVEWKDKKIGALERQKEYSDAIRIERDELRDEVAMLKERLKAYGMLTNGEAEPIRKEGNAHTEATETGLQAAAQLQSSSDGPLGESHELQMRNEILETVGERGVLQHTGIDEQMEETGNREMLMDNVQEKDITEECEALTESETPAVTVRDNGHTDQIERTTANLDDGEQSACDKQNLGGKQVSEGINNALGSGEGKQICGSTEENESDFGANGEQLHEDRNQNLDHDERRLGNIGEQSTHGGIRKEEHSEVGNDLAVVHDDNVGTGADNQAIVEETQKIVQQVLENAKEIFQQRTCGHELLEETRDKEEDATQVGGGLVQMKGDNLQREKPAETVHVEGKELDGMLITGPEQVAIGDIELYSTAQETEICFENFHNDIARESQEAAQVLLVAPGWNGQSGSSGEDVDSSDGPVQGAAENGERNDQDRSEQPVDNASTASVELGEEVEKMAEETEIGTNSLTQAALQEVEVGKEVTCHPRGMNASIVGNEVKQLIVTGEDSDWRDEVTETGRAENSLQFGEVNGEKLEKVVPDEAEADPGAEQSDEASQVMQQGKVDGKLEHGCLQEMTPTGGEKKVVAEVEDRGIEIEGDIKDYGEDEVRSHGAVEEKVKNPDLGAARNYGKNEDMDDIKAQGDERQVKGHNTDEGKGNKGDKKENDHGQGESKVKNTRNDEDETKDYNCDKIKGQGEKEGEVNDGQNEIENCETVKVLVQVPGEVNSEFKGKGDESGAQGSSATELKGFEEEGGEIKGSREKEGEVKCSKEEKGEVEGHPEQEHEVKDPPEEGEVEGSPKEEGEAKSLSEEEGEVKGPPEKESEAKSLSEEEGEVKDTAEEEGEAKGPPEEEGEAKGPPEEEGEVIVVPEEKGEVKSPPEEEGEVIVVPEEKRDLKSPPEEEGEVKGPPEEDGEAKGPSEEEGEAKGPSEEKGEVKDPAEEEGEVKGPPEEDGEATGPSEEEGEDNSPPEEEGEAKGPPEEEGEVIVVPEEKGEVKSPPEEEGEVIVVPEEKRDLKSPPEEESEVKGPEVRGPSEEEMDEVRGPSEEEMDEVRGPSEEEMDEVRGPSEEEMDEVRGPSEEEMDEVRGPSEEEMDEVRGPSEEEMDEVRGPSEEEEAKGPSEHTMDDIKIPRQEVMDEIRDHREEEMDGVRGPREQEEQTKDHSEQEGANFEQESENLLCTNMQGIVQEIGKEVSTAENSKEAVFPDLQTVEAEKEEMEEKRGAEVTECDLSSQVSVVVQESGKGNQIQSKSTEETNGAKPENNTEDVHKVTDSKDEQGTPTKKETGITEEATVQESVPMKHGEEIRQVTETCSSSEEFGENAQMSAGVVSDLDESVICELNKGSEEVAPESLQQGPVKSGTVLVKVIDQGMIMQDGKRGDPVKEGGDMSGASNEPHNKAQSCETRKERADDAPVSQINVEEQELREGDEDAEEGGRFEWDDEMSEILGDETQDKKEAPEAKEERGEVGTGSEAKSQPILSAGPTEHVKLNTDNSGAGVLIHQEGEHEGQEEEHEGQGGEHFRVKKFIDEKEALLEQIKNLKAQLDERSTGGKAEKAASSDTILENGTDVQVIEVQRDANRQISEYKFKLTKTEQEITALEQNVLRYKTAAENAEKVEDELKAEKRKLQREVRSALDKIDELEMSNSHLSKRLEKMKANRSALLSQQ
ncbi:uncharacterized protein LOC144503420 [Mustelus asterias]